MAGGAREINGRRRVGPVAGSPLSRGAPLAGAVVGTAVLSGLVWWVLPEEAVLSPWWTQVLGWPVALLLRVDPVQRWIGGGRLDNRVWLRLTIAGAVFAATVAPTGMSFLFPAFAALTACVHLQWSGSRAWRPCVTMTLALSTALQVLVRTGWLPTALPWSLDLVATVITVVLSLLTIGNVALLTAQRETESAALDLERRSRHDALLHAATHDSLSGRLNRAGLQEHLTRCRTDAVGVLYVDLDHFKPVNDRYGHAAGDLLLRLAADRLAALLRPEDGLGRLGGDEFVVLLATGDAAVVADVAARAATALRAPFDLDGTLVRVSASVGTALSLEPVTFEDLLRRADAAMYAEKVHHRRRVAPAD
ncbi:diguanylate cyclase domain-containing protein [Kineococcus sp. TBRC 1896]|uniref:Diguanylate cyclase domain-containing protein n=1 Tax=Kineococcus mangrovi TaxID=1660183 RepID=A0ABV4I7F9_9ACTN